MVSGTTPEPPPPRDTRGGAGFGPRTALAAAVVAGGASLLAGASVTLALALALLFGSVGLIPESMRSRLGRWFDRFFHAP
jgi:hypothetical protein